MAVLSIGIIIRLLISYLINTYPELFFGVSSNDAIGFSEKASILSENLTLNNLITTIKWNSYPAFLAIIYHISYPNIYIGSLLSIFIWSISFVIIHDTLKILKVSNVSKFKALIFYTFFPTLIIFSSITLRDVFILFFLNNILNLFVRFYYKKYFIYLLLILINLIFILSLHEKFALIFPLFFCILYFFVFLIINIFKKKIKLIYSLIILLLLLFIINIDNLLNLSNIYVVLNNFQYGALSILYQGNAQYRFEIFYIDNFFDFTVYLFSSFYKYMFSPFITDLSKIRNIDFIVIIENLFRLLIILFCFLRIKYFHKNNYYFFILFLIIYFTIEISWSLGTFNWGTGIRHHFTSLGVLTIIIGYLFDNMRIKNVSKK